MVLFNYAIREITAKLVYYGPGLCGKTTNLQFIHEKLDPGARGKLLSLATDGDRTLFFDFLPIEMGSIGGYKVRFQLYTVPGQVHYNATRKLVLKGVDAVAFVADSQVSMVERNRESFENLIENLIENGYDPAKIPIVIQCNKRDLPHVASVGELVAAMGVEGYPVLEAVANRGDGVFETLKTIVKLTLSRLHHQFEGGAATGAERPEAAVPPPPPPPPAGSAFVQTAPPPPPPPPPARPPAPPPAPPASVSAFAPPPPPPAAAAFAPASVPAAARAPFGTENVDEFDLTDFADEAPPPPHTPGPAFIGEEQPFGEEVDLESGFDTTPRGAGVEERAGFATDEEEVDWEAAPADDSYGFRPEFTPEGAADALPPWAVEMQEQMQRLRDENHELREMLRSLSAAIGEQIETLGRGRDELDRRLAAKPGEKES